MIEATIEKEEVRESDSIAREIEQLGEKLSGGEVEAKGTEPEKTESAAPTAPEKKPEEQQPPIDAEKDDDVPPEKRDNAWHARQRLRLKAERERANALELKVRELEAQRSQPSPSPEREQPEKQEASKPNVSTVATWLVTALNNGFQGNPAAGLNAEQHNRQVAELSRKALVNEYDESAIIDLIEKAERKEFGDQSDDVLAVARDILPRVIAKDNMARKRQEQERSTVNAQATAQKAELLKVVEKHPEFRDANSAEYKHIGAWMNRWIGERDAQGNQTKPGLLSREAAAYVTSHPLLQAELVKLDLRAGSVDALKQENEKLKQQLEKYRQPESGGRPSSGSPAARDSDGVKAELEKQFGPLD